MQHFTSKDGTTIACEPSGWGPPVLLVHGTATDHTRWTPIVPALAQGCTVYPIDRRGRGESSDASDYVMAREFEDVAAVVETLGVPVDLVAHSYGALCALEATRLVTNIRRLVLYEPPLPLGGTVYPTGILERLQQLLDSGDREAVIIAFMREVMRVPEDQLVLMRSLPAWQVRVAVAHTVVRELRALQAYNFQPETFRDVRVPTLLLLGGDSPEPFYEAAHAIHDALPTSRIAVMPAQKHNAMETAPELFLKEVLGFFSARVSAAKN